MTGAPAASTFTMTPIGRVLAVAETEVDGPQGAEAVLQAAAGLAQRHGAALEMLACMVPPADLSVIARAAGTTPEACLQALSKVRQQAMEEIAARALPAKQPDVHMAIGNPFIEVVRHVVHNQIDMVVKTARPLSGLHGVFFASTDQHLLRKCPCPVWLRAPDAALEPRTIVAAVDVDLSDAREPETLTQLNCRVIETALRLGSLEHGVVHVLHAWEALGEGLIWTFAADIDPGAAAQRYLREVEAERRRSLAALLQPFRTRAAATPRLTESLVRGPTRSVIAEQAKRLSADLIVLGTVARTGLRGVIIGNTAEDILNSVDCSVVAVKPEGFVSPVAPEARVPIDQQPPMD
ncbi:MAG: universal stress protein [Geminicoccaceae bacterium]